MVPLECPFSPREGEKPSSPFLDKDSGALRPLGSSYPQAPEEKCLTRIAAPQLPPYSSQEACRRCQALCQKQSLCPLGPGVKRGSKSGHLSGQFPPHQYVEPSTGQSEQSVWISDSKRHFIIVHFYFLLLRRAQLIPFEQVLFLQLMISQLSFFYFLFFSVGTFFSPHRPSCLPLLSC